MSGPWAGTSAPLALDFQLQEGAGGAVTGSGTMR
ncbi:MAG: hypothetical protein AVDCRST_MAG89-1103 [uncultured Gemmatimonadetes bacterium]|uniref:Uncharacterized protein n=1 Tax=uncultured Gemmatimonadota bacterium TaxID=203437 RepID=A0A6J4KQN1_9BACT|nr:MAG: hypothetical protein AVDCRST_MAG89-1103 [uncultured Gemmatimonadota bacterium]